MSKARALRSNLSSNQFHIKTLPRAVRFSGDTAVCVDPRSGDVELAREETAQLHQACQLRWRWIIVIEIADQADPDAMLIVILVRRLAVCPMFLLQPSRPDFDLSVRRVRAVADDKVIAELIPAFGSVPFIKAFGATDIGCAVMDDDALPAVGGMLRQPLGFICGRRAGAM